MKQCPLKTFVAVYFNRLVTVAVVVFVVVVVVVAAVFMCIRATVQTKQISFQRK